MPFRVTARAWISSSEGGTGSRSPRPDPAISLGAARSASTGRSAAPITRHATNASTSHQQRERDQQDSAEQRHWTRAPRSGAATTTVNRCPPTETAAPDADAEPIAPREPGTAHRSVTAAHLLGAQQSHEPVGVCDARPPGPLGIDDLDDLQPRPSEGAGEVARLDQVDHLGAGRQRLGVDPTPAAQVHAAARATPPTAKAVARPSSPTHSRAGATNAATERSRRSTHAIDAAPSR